MRTERRLSAPASVPCLRPEAHGCLDLLATGDTADHPTFPGLPPDPTPRAPDHCHPPAAVVVETLPSLPEAHTCHGLRHPRCVDGGTHTSPADGPPHPALPSGPLLIDLGMSQDLHLNSSKITLTNLTPTGTAVVVKLPHGHRIDASHHNKATRAGEAVGASEPLRTVGMERGEPLWETDLQLLKKVSPRDPARNTPRRTQIRASKRHSCTRVHCSQAAQSQKVEAA